MGGTFIDTWSHLFPDDEGWTFSNLPSQADKMARPDRILVSGHQCSVKNVSIHGKNENSNNWIVPSDHRALLVNFAW